MTKRCLTTSPSLHTFLTFFTFPVTKDENSMVFTWIQTILHFSSTVLWFLWRLLLGKACNCNYSWTLTIEKAFYLKYCWTVCCMSFYSPNNGGNIFNWGLLNDFEWLWKCKLRNFDENCILQLFTNSEFIHLTGQWRQYALCATYQSWAIKWDSFGAVEMVGMTWWEIK